MVSGALSVTLLGLSPNYTIALILYSCLGIMISLPNFASLYLIEIGDIDF